jgi:hypothetical protein
MYIYIYIYMCVCVPFVFILNLYRQMGSRLIQVDGSWFSLQGGHADYFVQLIWVCIFFFFFAVTNWFLAVKNLFSSLNLMKG